MTSTALAAGAMVLHPFDAFAQPTAAQGAAKKDPETPTFAERES